MIAQQTLLETRDGPGRWGQGGAGAVRPVPLDEATEGLNDRRGEGVPSMLRQSKATGTA